MNPTKSINKKVRQNVRLLHTSRLALGNLWKTLDVRVVGFALAGTKWGRIELATSASSVHFHIMPLQLISSFHSNPQLKRSF